MQNLPTKSESSFTNGLWFVFKAEGHIVRAWSSFVSGMERIYVDDALVSEQRSMKLQNVHAFTIAGKEYSVAFRTSIAASFLRGEHECTLLEEGKRLKVSRWWVKNLFIVWLLPVVLSWALVNLYFGLKFDLPIWPQLVVLFFVAVVLAIYRKKGICLEEITLQPGETVKP